MEAMKRIATLFSFGLAGVALFGCPIYSQTNSQRVCNSTGCYRCPNGVYDSECDPWACTRTTDCPNGYVCDPNALVCVADGAGTCKSPTDCAAGQTCASDGKCRPGDCSTNGCVSGFVCKVSGGTASCVPGTVSDAGPDAAPPPQCMDDTGCAQLGQGAKCLSGKCFAPSDLCADATQCQEGYQCVAGVCTPSCSAQKPCPTGYQCDTGKGVCTLNPNPCTTSSQCSGGQVCVQQHCVAPCGPNDTCPTGLVCVAGGCMPDQKPTFVCSMEGTQDVCKMGSLCLRHNCYISCDADAADSCKNADKFNVCKQVSTGSGTYSVCGSGTNLGSECDPTQGKACNGGLICIDGFCR